MARNRLSETRCKSLPKGIHTDGDGLYLRVHASGSRNWVFIWRRGDKRNEMGLGGYGQGTAPVSLALAREKAEKIRQALARGDDPRQGKPSRRQGVHTFEEAMESLLTKKGAELKSDKQLQQWQMTLRTYARPLHDLPVDRITRDDVLRCVEKHWLDRPETARRLRARIANVMDHAKAREWRKGDNPAEWRGGLQELLPKHDQKLSRGHHAALPYEQAPAAIQALRAANSLSGRAVEFLALTAVRSGEVRGAVWDEIDLDNALWTIPPDRMKMKSAHRVPLTERAVEILKVQKKLQRSALVFEGEVDDAPVSSTAMTKTLRKAAGIDAVTLHGWRSTFRDWAGDTTNHARDVMEAALAHVVGNKTEAAYRRADALAKRRVLMEDWEAYLSTERGGDNVLPMKRRAEG
jgi:integrase